MSILFRFLVVLLMMLLFVGCAGNRCKDTFTQYPNERGLGAQFPIKKVERDYRAELNRKLGIYYLLES